MKTIIELQDATGWRKFHSGTFPSKKAAIAWYDKRYLVAFKDAPQVRVVTS